MPQTPHWVATKRVHHRNIIGYLNLREEEEFMCSSQIQADVDESIRSLLSASHDLSVTLPEGFAQIPAVGVNPI